MTKAKFHGIARELVANGYLKEVGKNIFIGVNFSYDFFLENDTVNYISSYSEMYLPLDSIEDFELEYDGFKGPYLRLFIGGGATTISL